VRFTIAFTSLGWYSPWGGESLLGGSRSSKA